MRTKHRAALAALAMVWLSIVVGGGYALGAAPAPIKQLPIDLSTPQLGAATQAYPLRIDAGAKASFTDHDGHVWLADTGFIGGTTYDRSHISVGNTENDPIYQTERYDLTGYSLPVSDGRYTVRLHFAEMYYKITAAGQRVFNLNVEGTELEKIDIFAEARGRYRAMVRSVDVTVNDGFLDLRFTPLVQYPKIDGIEVLPLNPEPTSTSPRTPTPTRAPTATATAPATPRVPPNAPPRPIYIPLVLKPAPPPPTQAPCGDLEDADDTPSTAINVAVGTVCAGSVQQDELYGDDWFATAAPAGRALAIDLSGMPAGADYDLFLFDASLRQVGASRQSGNAPEHIGYAPPAAATYYIRVVVYAKSAQAPNTYVLGVAAR